MPHEKENASSKPCMRGDAADDIPQLKPFCDGKRNKGKEEGAEKGKWKQQSGRGVEMGIVTVDGNVKGFYLAG